MTNTTLRRTSTLSTRYDAILATRHLQLNGTHTIKYDMDKDMLWRVEPLATHPNGMRFSVFGEQGDLIATNEYFSVSLIITNVYFLV